MRRLAVLLVVGLAACGQAGDDEVPAAEDKIPRAEEAIPAEDDVEGGIDSPPWRAARARGVDFRAHGQEPGWTVDIDREGVLVYSGDYGSDTVSAPTPAPRIDELEQIWTVREGTREVEVRVREGRCEDTMSGERFSHTVSIRVDGTALEGCGRWLER